MTSTDYVADLLDRGAERAAAEGLVVTFALADAEALPFADAAFDVVLSTFGVMFAPNHEARRGRARPRLPSRRTDRARQLDAGEPRRTDVRRARQRTCRRPPGCSRRRSGASPSHLEELFGGQRRVDRGDAARVLLPLPLGRALRRRVPARGTARCTRRSRALPTARRRRLERDLVELLERSNIADGSLVIPSEYLEVVVTRQLTASAGLRRPPEPRPLTCCRERCAVPGEAWCPARIDAATSRGSSSRSAVRQRARGDADHRLAETGRDAREDRRRRCSASSPRRSPSRAGPDRRT